VFLAHAFGQRYDLPIPLVLFVVGGAGVVFASFLLVAARPVPAATGPVADRVYLGRPGRLPGLTGVLALLLLVACGLWGSQEVAENILPTTFWLILWIAVPLSCAIIGDWTQPLNPFAALARLADRPRLRAALLGSETPVRWPDRLGWWPAVLLFFVVASGELVFNLTATVPANTALALLAYAVLSLAAGLLFGPAWLERGELFTVLFATWGRLGYFRFGAPGRRRFAGGLDVPFEPTASRLAFVLMLLVSVNFDGLLATPSWHRLEQRLPGNLPLHPAGLDAWRTLVFIALAGSVAAVFGAFAGAAGWINRPAAGGTAGVRPALAGLLPSLLPIAFGYLLAHNLQYLAVNSQLLLPLLGNPVGSGRWPLHLPYPFNDGYEPHAHLLPAGFYWYLSVAVIVAVHIVAVVLAHRQLSGARGPAARSAEYPWLAAMVGYTMLSLWLLAQPLVAERHTGPAPATAVVHPVVVRGEGP
jgi:hypothetical protein